MSYVCTRSLSPVCSGSATDARTRCDHSLPPPKRTTRTRRSSSSLREKLAGLGIAGILAYGLLNTLYYTVAFLFFYLCIIHPPRGGDGCLLLAALLLLLPCLGF